MASTLLLKRQLINVIKRFKFEELEDAVMPVLPEISWSRVRSKLVKNHKNFTVINAVYIFKDVLDNVDLSVKDLRDRLGTLEVIDISRHNKRKMWYGHELRDLNEALRYIDRLEIQERIKEEFFLRGLKMDVKAVMYNDIMFIYVKEEKKSKRRLITPTFFALFEHKYFFCSRKNVPSDYVEIIAVSMGYTNSIRIKLVGKDLKSLIKLLWMKQQGTSSAGNISQPPIYQPSDPNISISNNGMDYTQKKQRKKHAEQCFGKDSPTLELLVVKGKEMSVQHDIVGPKLNDDRIYMNWEFRSHDIIKFLTALIEKRIVTLPLPDYISNLLTSGRNELKLTDRTNQS